MRRLAATSAATLIAAVAAVSALGAGVPARVTLTHGAHAACAVGDHPQPGAAVEPMVAASPSDPSRLIATWQQDRYASGGSLAFGVSVSGDGGRTWRQRVVPGMTDCPSGGNDRTSDPWASIGAGGGAYLAGVPGALGASGEPVTNVAVSHSPDGGETWQAPVAVTHDQGTFNDKESVTADPFRANTAYVAWTRDITSTWFAKTSDGGSSWSSPKRIFNSSRRGQSGSVVAVLRDGTLVDVLQASSSDRTAFEAVTSRNGGTTWSRASRIASDRSPGALVAPDGRSFIRAPAPGLPSVATRGNTVFVAWTTQTARKRSSLLLSRSTDGGATWRRPRLVARSGRQLLLPALAVSPSGVLAVTYYGFDAPRRHDKRVLTSVWFSRSRDGGKSWRRSRLAGPFDYRRAPLTEAGFFLGDYTGLTATTGGFGAVFSLPGSRARRSNVFAARLR
jgi:hypothetical protein